MLKRLDTRPADAIARDGRDRLLAASDWTQMPDASLSDVARAEWAAYRQALREVPQQPDFPLSINWPAKPE